MGTEKNLGLMPVPSSERIFKATIPLRYRVGEVSGMVRAVFMALPVS
jgi:hypothetical protein